MKLKKLKRQLYQFARKLRYPSTLPSRALILLTNPRSGSTWLTDAIRCHPAVEFWPYATLYKHLGFSRSERRYPRDLSNGPDAVKEIEMSWERWERIPLFDISEDIVGKISERFLREKYAIEKFHPESFNFDVHTFLNNVRKVESKGVRLSFIFSVRDPKSSFTSFMNYQDRNPTWYPTTKDEELAIYMKKTYEDILEIAKCYPGIVVDYTDIATNLELMLQEIYCYIWPNLFPAEINCIQQVSRAAVKATSRDKRSAVGSSFLGKTVGPIEGGLAKYRDFFERYDSEVTHCYSSYRHLLDLKTGYTS